MTINTILSSLSNALLFLFIVVSQNETILLACVMGGCVLLLVGTLIFIWYCIRRRRKNNAAGQGRDRSQVDDVETDDMSSASGASFSTAFDPPFTFRGAVNHGASLVNPRPFFWKNNIPLNELPDNFHTPKVRHISNTNLSLN